MLKKVCFPAFVLLFAVVFFPGCGTTLLVKNVVPAQGATVSLMRPDWREILAERRAKVVAPGEKLDYADNKGFPVPVAFSWEGGAGPYTLEISRNASFSPLERSLSTAEPQAKVYHLQTGRVYYWRVKASDKVSAVFSFRTPEDEIRQILVAETGPVNVRDWGGKRLQTGGRTRQGMVYRGTQMQKPFDLTEEARRVMLEELNIRTDLDLRYPQNVAGMTESPLGPASRVRWLHYAINAYHSFEAKYIAEQMPLWRDTIRTFAVRENYPIYFHCFGGVDRTGEVALLLNFLLGVEEEQAFLDYEFSSMAYFPRKRTIGYLQRWLKNIGSYDLSPNATWQSKTEKFLLAIGVTPGEIDAIREILTEK